MRRQETNIYEIAKEAGVSIATVSRVMNHSSTVSDKSTQRVLEAIEKLNYVPNLAARNLSTSSSTSVGVVFPDINNPFFMQLLQGITSAADEMGLSVLLFGTDEDMNREHKILQSMRELRLRGIIITPVSAWDKTTREMLENYEALGIPVVLLDRELDDCNIDRIVTADEEGTFLAVSEMIRLGHRKIGMISGPEFSRPGCERLNGFYRAMREAGLPVRDEYVRKGDFRVNRAYCETLALCGLPDPPTAVFSSNNLTTYGCLRAFNKLGLKLGEDIALFGFDDIEELNWLDYHISVVSRDVTAMGEQAMRHLLQRVDGSNQQNSGMRICLPTELIMRGSEQFPTARAR